MTRPVVDLPIRDRARLAWEQDRAQQAGAAAAKALRDRDRTRDLWKNFVGLDPVHITFLDEEVKWPLIGGIAVVDGVFFCTREVDYRLAIGLATKCGRCYQWAPVVGHSCIGSLSDLHKAFTRFDEALHEALEENLVIAELGMEPLLPDIAYHAHTHGPDFSPSSGDRLVELIQEIAREGADQ